MRLSSVMFAVALLFSSVVFAQHSSTSSAPSSAAPSSPPAAPASSPSPASSSSSSSSASSFHSAPSSPSPASPPSFSSSSPSSMSSHGSSASASSISEPAASHSQAQTNEAQPSDARPSEPHGSEAAPERFTPGAKIGSEEKIAPSSRIGEGPAANGKEQEKERYKRAPESDLRRPICKDGPCKEVVPKPPVESDLRRPVCKDKLCTCPPGEVQGQHGGCVASNPTNGSDQCGTGQYWNGGACTAIVRACQANEYWNGVACVNSQAECANFSASAASVANEVRAARAQMQSACMDDPSGQECSNLKQNYAGAIERYRMAMSGAPANCRAMLPDPLSL
jgi:hypothetical protein